MELKNLKVNFIGDSITEGVGASSYETCYVSRFAAMTGAICRNYGISGTRIARRKVPYEIPEFDRDFNSRYHLMEEDADVIVVFRERFLWSLPQEAALEILMFFDWKTMMGVMIMKS